MEFHASEEIVAHDYLQVYHGCYRGKIEAHVTAGVTVFQQEQNRGQILSSPYDTINNNWKPAFSPSIQQIEQAMVLEGEGDRY